MGGQKNPLLPEVWPARRVPAACQRRRADRVLQYKREKFLSNDLDLNLF